MKWRRFYCGEKSLNGHKMSTLVYTGVVPPLQGSDPERAAQRAQKAAPAGVSGGIPKTAQRLVQEVLYGVQCRASVRLSEIARSLQEKTSIKKIMGVKAKSSVPKPLAHLDLRSLLRILYMPGIGRVNMLNMHVDTLNSVVCL